MSFTEILPYLLTGFALSALHASLPTHWLPFVLAGKSQKWSFQRTSSILFIAGIGHVLTTSILGAGIVWLGLNFKETDEKYLTVFSAIILISYGIWHIWKHFKGVKHSHCNHEGPHSHNHAEKSKDGWAILGLLSYLTFSPCMSFVPLYLTTWQFGWFGFYIMSLSLLFGTLIMMFLFMSLSYLGFSKLKLDWIENYEKLVIGFMLVGIGCSLYLIHSLVHIH